MKDPATPLFDAPGPRGRAIQRIAAVVLTLVALALIGLALWRLGERGNLTPEKWAPFLTAPVWTSYLLPGLISTLTAAAISMVLAMALGLALGLGRMSGLAPVRWACGVFVEFFRSVPVLVMMIFAFWAYSMTGAFQSTYIALAGTVTGLVTYNSCVLAELIRSSLRNLPSGQAEAGAAIGLTDRQNMFLIQLPQALRLALPALVSQLVIVMKDSALGYQITYAELLRNGERVGTSYANIVPSLIVVALVFITINYALSRLATWLERRLSRSRSAGETAEDIGIEAGIPMPH